MSHNSTGAPISSSQYEQMYSLFFLRRFPFKLSSAPHPQLNSPLRFNPTPIFLTISFDCTLSFSTSSLKAKFYSRLKAIRCISASSWGSSKWSFSLLYKAFLRPLFTYASPGWFSFFSLTNLTKLEDLHQAASRAITGCLPSFTIPLLLSKTFVPPLRVTDSFCSVI